MRVSQAMIDHLPAAKYQCPSCGAYRLAVTMVWSGVVWRYVCRTCQPDGSPTLGRTCDRGKVRWCGLDHGEIIERHDAQQARWRRDARPETQGGVLDCLATSQTIST